MGQIGNYIASAGRMTVGYGERLLKDLKADTFARFAAPGGKMVQSNHPAFVFGHLARYPWKWMDLLGEPQGATAVTPAWEALFKPGAECVDDPKGTIYPKMEEITKLYFEGHKAGLAAIADAPDEFFTKPNQAEGRFKEMLPSMGGVMSFYVGGHPMSHLGQVSAWRRMMGLGSAM